MSRSVALSHMFLYGDKCGHCSLFGVSVRLLHQMCVVTENRNKFCRFGTICRRTTAQLLHRATGRVVCFAFFFKMNPVRFAVGLGAEFYSSGLCYKVRLMG